MDNGTERRDPVEAMVDAHREAMWAAIAPAWRARAARRRRARTVRAWSAAGFGLAATLVVGIVVGRWSAGAGGAGPQSPATAILADAVTIERPLSTPYRVAVSEHFREAETLLVLFDASAGPDPELGAFARELAARSRLLTDSSVGRDAEIRSLLLDLELLLVQIARLVDDVDATEAQIVRDGIVETDALWRVRRMLADDAGETGI